MQLENLHFEKVGPYQVIEVNEDNVPLSQIVTNNAVAVIFVLFRFRRRVKREDGANVVLKDLTDLLGHLD